MDRRPQPSVSPRRLHPRRPSSVSATSGRVTAASAFKKSPLHSGASVPVGLPTAARHHNDVTPKMEDVSSVMASALFERGRFYDLYAARRNERLKRKMKVEAMTGEVETAATELARRRGLKRTDGIRRSLPAPVYMPSSARSSKEKMKKSCAAADAARYGGCTARSARRLSLAA